MTDEEKAKEYATEQMKSYLTLDDYSYGVLKLKITEAYLDGLAECRKEKCLEQNNDGTIRPCEVMRENETLTKRILELQKTCGALTDKVEKMKCCGNCKYGEIDGDFCYAYKQEQRFIEKCCRWEQSE